MTLRFPTATQNAHTTTNTALFDGGAGAATIAVYSGPQPASANDAASGVLLWTWTLDDPSWGAPVAGTADLDVTPELTTTAVAGGTAGWFRVRDSNGNTVEDGAVGAELNINNPTVVIGQTVILTAGAFTTPAS